MKKSILVFLVLTASSSYAQIEIWMLNGTFSYFGQISVKDTILPGAKLALVRSAGDTIWFDRRPDFIRFAFNPADLQASYTPKPRFSVGDSVTALLVRQPNPYWINGVVLDRSTSNRYLIKFRDTADYNERTKKFNYRNVRSWFDENDIEKFVDAKKFR